MNFKLTNIFISYDKMNLKLLTRILVFFFFSTTVFSQNAKVTINTDKEVTVVEIFNLIKNQTQYSFVYDYEMVKDSPKIFLKAGEIKASVLLEMGLNPIKCTYEFSNNTVIVKKKTETELKVSAQKTFTITGIVLDEEGNELPGATVYITSKEPESERKSKDFLLRGTQTDFDGKFSLKASTNSYLTASFLGYRIYTEKIMSSKIEYIIVLKESQNQLDEIVITGYTEIKRSRTAASSAKITGKAIERQKTLNVSSRLEGLSPGLLTTVENGDGGEELTFTLRGQSTFDQDGASSQDGARANRANRAPLIVVDGFPIEGGLNSVNPNDIDSIEQLQDAAATALWGVRASNGVIVITTKKGEVGKPKFSYSTNLFINEKPNLDNLQVASTSETVDIISDFIKTGGDRNVTGLGIINPQGFNSRALNSVQQIWFNYYNQSGNLPTDPDDLVFAPIRDAALVQLSQNDAFNDFSDALLRTSFSQQYNLSVRGGSPASSYYFSMTYNDIESTLVGDNSDRLNLLLNNKFIFSNKFRADISANVVFDNSENNSEGLGILVGGRVGLDEGALPRFNSLYNADGSLSNIPRGFNVPYKDYLTNSGQGYLDWSYNPITETRNNDFKIKGRTYRFNLGFQYDILDWLTADVKAQYELGTNQRRRYSNADSYRSRNLTNFWLSQDANGFPFYGFPRGGILDLDTRDFNSLTLRGQLNADKIIGKHHITATVGAELRNYTTERDVRQLLGYNDKSKVQQRNIDWEFLENQDRYATPVFPSGVPGHTNPANISFTETRQISAFGNVVYTYNNKYSINGTIKQDQTNLFGVSARLRANPLWAVGGNWNIGKEDFFNVNWIDNLNIKASYGVSGNILPGSRAVAIFEQRNGLTSSGSGIISTGRPGNPELTFEKTATTNLSIEGRFFNKIYANFEYYNRKSTDLLIPAAINPTFGFESLTINNGELKNSGVTATLSGDIIRSKDFTWNTNANFTYNKNQVVRYDFQRGDNVRDYTLSGGQPGGYFEGRALGVRAVYQWGGLTDTGGSQVFDENGNIIAFNDPNFGFFGIENIDVLGYTKPLQAPYFGGVTNSFSYKEFTLSALMVYKAGHVYEKRGSTIFALGGETVFHKDIANRWREPGDEETADIPAYQSSNNFTNRTYLDRSNIRYQDASFVRLRDVTLSYSLNDAALKKLPFDSVIITIQARNLGLLWRANKDNVDPEYAPFTGGSASTNIEPLVLSRQNAGPNKQFVFGIDFNF